MRDIFWKRALVIVGLPGIVFVVFYILQPSRFGDIRSIYIILQQAMLPSIMAWGLFFILTLGLWDFSLGGVMVLSSIIGGVVGLIGNTFSPTLGYISMFTISIAVSSFLCFFNGTMFVKLKIPSIVVTIGLLMIYEILATLVPGTTGTGISLYRSISIFGRPPYNLMVGFASMFFAYFLYGYTKLGIHIRAIGHNEIVAKNMGVKIEKITMLAFFITGVFVGINGVLTLSYSSMMTPQTSLASLGRIFTPVMGCMIGIILRIYINPIIGILIGEFTIAMLITGLMAINIDATIQKVVIGIFLIVMSSLVARERIE